MKRLYAIDETLSSLFAPFEKISSEIELPFICHLSDEQTIAQQKYPGIYRIDVLTKGVESELKPWVDAFRSEWEHEDFKKRFTPNLKEKRIAGHNKLLEWMPIYLGKSKNVAGRVLEHINLPLHKTTFALKIKARPSMSARQFRLHAIELRVKNYDILAPALEAALRNRFHPLIGKQ